MVLASALGWGTGYPDCQRDQCVWITAGGIKLLVRAEVAPIFKGFCDELVQRGYPLGDVADDWGFACRSIRGSTAPSNHSWGLAIDLNATTNPMTSSLVTDFPQWAVELGEKKYGLRWGGRYATRPDAMHWEWVGTPKQAAWLIAALAALPSNQQPPEPPQQEDDMGATEQAQLDSLGQMLSSVGKQIDSLGQKVDSVAANLFDADDRAQLDNVRADVTTAIQEIRVLAQAVGAVAVGDTATAEQIVDEIAERLA